MPDAQKDPLHLWSSKIGMANFAARLKRYWKVIYLQTGKTVVVFNPFKKKTPLQKLEKEYASALELARDLQRKGDIVGFSEQSAVTNGILKQIQAEEIKCSPEGG